MKYYCLDPISGEALRADDGTWLQQTARPLPAVPGRTDEAEAGFAIPGNAAINAPIEPRHAGEVPVAEAIELDERGYPVANWVLRPDFRGQRWFDRSGQLVVVQNLGDPSHDGLVTQTPKVRNTHAKSPVPAKGLLDRLFGGREAKP